MHAQAHEVGAVFDDDEQEEEDVTQTIGRKRQVVGILVLQLGIMVHSLVIGLTLAVTSGGDFTSLLTAIVFHQLFEGLSLGIRIAGLPPSSAPRHHWLVPTLFILFAITTPMGMFAGVVIFPSMQAGESIQLQLTQGLMAAISAGMLIYASTVEMLAGDFVFGDDEHEYKSPVVKKILAITSLLAGATAMALVGLGE
ncbi:hypothetical protein C0993_005867 [Termitomyces sp. T159_Od127]|nr:hypothetical protein C0993_005867 [Termitomyces sp. T159_Od127]